MGLRVLSTNGARSSTFYPKWGCRVTSGFSTMACGHPGARPFSVAGGCAVPHGTSASPASTQQPLPVLQPQMSPDAAKVLPPRGSAVAPA